MNVVRKSPRLVATAAATALAAAALVGLTSTTASATPVTNSYVCQNADVPGVGPWTVSLLSDAPILNGFPQIGAGTDVGAGLVELTNTFTIPQAAHDTLVAYGVEDLSFPDFAGTFGDATVDVLGMTAKVSEMTENGDGSWSFDSPGANAAFEVPAAGVYDVLSPAAFTLAATVGANQVPVTCTLTPDTSAGSYATIEVVKNASTASGKPVARTLKTTKVAKMKVTVDTAGAQIATGKVIVKEGTQKLGSATLNDLGKATVAMGKLSKGKHKVKVIYKGDGYTLGDKSDPIVFMVIKP